jgi:hypothetical protein
MSDLYFEEDYAESDYVEGYVMAIDALPTPGPQRTQPPAVFIERMDALLAALPLAIAQIDAVAIAMNNNATNAESASTLAIGTGNKTFIADAGKSYVNGQTVRAAATTSPTVWMQGDLIAYNPSTGELTINMNTVQGSGTYSAWTISLSNATTSAGSLTQDFSVQSLIHAIGSNIASATTIDLSAADGNFVHVTGNTGISAATMTAGKAVWVTFDGTPVLTHHASNHKLNNNGSNIAVAAGGMALYTYDGTTVRVIYFAPNGKANSETAPPAGAPVGSFLLYAGSSPPAGYLTCPTTLTYINRTTYAALFSAIGTTWDPLAVAPNFALPWFAADYTMLQASSNVGSASTGTIKAHTHTLPLGTADASGSPWVADGDGPLSAQVGTTNSTGGAANLAAGARVLICVKYQ